MLSILVKIRGVSYHNDVAKKLLEKYGALDMEKYLASNATDLNLTVGEFVGFISDYNDARLKSVMKKIHTELPGYRPA